MFPVQQPVASNPSNSVPVTVNTNVSNSTGSNLQATLASKYGDGFVTSASHPELAAQYGNVGTRYVI